jgi:antitoxin VapB
VALNIKNARVEQLAADVAALTGESKTEAIRRSLEERKQRLGLQVLTRDRASQVRRFLEREVWPLVPKSKAGKRLTRAQEDAILGYGRQGV